MIITKNNYVLGEEKKYSQRGMKILPGSPQVYGAK